MSEKLKTILPFGVLMKNGDIFKNVIRIHNRVNISPLIWELEYSDGRKHEVWKKDVKEYCGNITNH